MVTARVIVIAVDGVTSDRLTSWVAEGRLPTFARLLADGAHAALGGSPPTGDLSAVCAIATAAGRRVRIVSGAVVEASPGHDCQVFCDELLARQRVQLADAVGLVDRRSADLLWVQSPSLDAMPRCCADVTSTSHAAHLGSGELGDTMLRIHQVLDEGLAEIVQRLDDETTLLVVSTPGVSIDSALEPWLEAAGFFTRKPPAPSSEGLGGIGAEVYAFVRALRRSSLDWLPKLVPQRLMSTTCGSATKASRPTSAANATSVEWSTTRVYSAPGGELRVNLRGREPHGVVAPEDFARVCDEVRAAWEARAEPTTLVVRRRHDVADALVDDGPDLIVTSSAAGLVLLVGSAVRDGAAVPRLGTDDVATTLLHLIGLPQPSSSSEVASHLLAGACHRAVDDVREEVGCP